MLKPNLPNLAAAVREKSIYRGNKRSETVKKPCERESIIRIQCEIKWKKKNSITCYSCKYNTA